MTYTQSENSNYLRPALIKNLVKDELNATIVECNTAYGGNRSNNIDHMKIARDHGFLDVANGFDLQDAEGYMTIPVKVVYVSRKIMSELILRITTPI